MFSSLPSIGVTDIEQSLDNTPPMCVQEVDEPVVEDDKTVQAKETSEEIQEPEEQPGENTFPEVREELVEASEDVVEVVNCRDKWYDAYLQLSAIQDNAYQLAAADSIGQSWWCRIKSIGGSLKYKERSSEVGKRLNQFFGITFLSSEKIDDCFEGDIMAVTPQNEKCLKFAGKRKRNTLKIKMRKRK
ncbi:Hypothetical predicted protein [Mytilus galloprovincialis]|uniref:Uncharacterized protein n=1 Tax=Mytilus galloprovincialis TaxID=29158 RepID=A0A8B6F7W1_MYTGA|nr:Hypothetical predicted protein [Mytilus galloprovincialis]